MPELRQGATVVAPLRYLDVCKTIFSCQRGKLSGKD